MSNPLKRRMAKVALVLAAGAAPVVATAGSASALSLPPTSDLGGLSGVDTDLGGTVEGAAQHTTEVAGALGGEAVKQAVPTTGKVVGTLSHVASPIVQDPVGKVSEGAGTLVDEASHQLSGGDMPEGIPGYNAPLPPLGVPGIGVFG
ncbi:ATP-binding protein [Streptomyces otsuchiensis]|uniref:ATP-binding protein n=1 Tax=Streptomyces otsuchiensis TaxID=2681388 RepID=UPI0010315953|nr:ATP-binding protein [Streptomyces otsuchiensis]